MHSCELQSPTQQFPANVSWVTILIICKYLWIQFGCCVNRTYFQCELILCLIWKQEHLFNSHIFRAVRCLFHNQFVKMKNRNFLHILHHGCHGYNARNATIHIIAGNFHQLKKTTTENQMDLIYIGFNCICMWIKTNG